MSTASSSAAILAEGLSKHYREVTAVDSLDLVVRAGEIYGFLGRNGAGKTTTIRLLLGLIRPTRGRVRLFGRDLATERTAALAAAGSLVESATFYPALTVRENLEIQRRLTGAESRAVAQALTLLNLDEYASRRAGRLSLGNKQRLALARALLHRPRILILDEPANGLDPAGIVEIRDLLRRLAREEGVTVFVSSHILSEVSQLADRIGIIHRGKLIEERRVGAEREGEHRFRIRVSDSPGATTLLRETFPGARLEAGGPHLLELTADSGAAIARVIVNGGLELFELTPVREDLEARFLRLTGGNA